MTGQSGARAPWVAAAAAVAALVLFPATSASGSTLDVSTPPDCAASGCAQATLVGDFGIGRLPRPGSLIPWSGGSSSGSGGSSQSGDPSGSGGSSQPGDPSSGSGSGTGGWPWPSGGGWPDSWSPITAPETTSASAEQSTGVVLINTTLGWGSSEAAGTGLVIDSSGIVVTNHHVVAGSTAVTVTVPQTGQSYRAEVLGYDSTADVAVLRLDDASGLTTITADTATPSRGTTVTGVGNAKGGGELVAAVGEVSATGVNITVSDSTGTTSSPLSDLIQTSARLVPGDSGGAMEEADGDVVGMNVAGAASKQVSVGYAIPIATVLDVATEVLAGRASDTITLGRTGGLGVSVEAGQAGVTVVGVVSGGPADQAGVTAGSVLNSLDGTPVTTRDSLAAALAQHSSGDRVSLSWTDSSGAAVTATVTLGEAPLA